MMTAVLLACATLFIGGSSDIVIAVPKTLPPLSDIPELVSRDGLLFATLEAREAKTVFGGAEVDTIIYNGVSAGPVLRVRPGDTMRIRLSNRLAEPTNLHFHGIQTSPRGNSDNMHVLVPAGQDFDYEVEIPKLQPPGAYWYHAHPHGLSEKQVGRGLSGALIVEGFAAQIPGLAGIRERLFVLKAIEVEDSDNPIVSDEWHGVIQTINGHLSIDERMRPGETALWHVSNHDANVSVRLALAGHRFTIVGRDSAVVRDPVSVDEIYIPPSSRAQVLVTAGSSGQYALIARNVLTGLGASLSHDREIGKIVVDGPAATPKIPELPSMADLSKRGVNQYRTFVFSQSKDSEQFYMNGRLFDADRIDTRVNLGDVEDWTIRNDSDDMHVFHIHQLPFQVIAINGKPIPFDGLLDTVRVPERGALTVRMAFTNPLIVGIFMYHCHVLKHEDKGMMQVIEVVDPKQERHAEEGDGATAPLRKLAGWLRNLVRADSTSIFGAPICRAVAL